MNCNRWNGQAGRRGEHEYRKSNAERVTDDIRPHENAAVVAPKLEDYGRVISIIFTRFSFIRIDMHGHGALALCTYF